MFVQAVRRSVKQPQSGLMGASISTSPGPTKDSTISDEAYTEMRKGWPKASKKKTS